MNKTVVMYNIEEDLLVEAIIWKGMWKLSSPLGWSWYCEDELQSYEIMGIL